MKKWNEQVNQSIGELIIYKNNQLIAFNKPPEIAVQQKSEGTKSLADLAEIYSKSKVFVIHRLDQPASGIILMAKNSQAQAIISEQLKTGKVEKQYLAVVKEPPQKNEGELIDYLSKNPKINKSFVVDKTQSKAKKAVLKYKVIGQSDYYHLLLIQLITGRHHQIRAQLAHIGSPIKGDVKYGFKRKNKDRSIHLHAFSLGFHHPISGEKVLLKAYPPEDPVWNAFKDTINQL